MRIDDVLGDLDLPIQISVRDQSGYVLDVALGQVAGGVELRTDHLLACYCAVKPLMALEFVSTCADASIDMAFLDADVGELLGDSNCNGFSPRQILSHDAGLQWPSGIEYLLSSSNQRASASIVRRVSGRAFSEVQFSLLLARLAAALLGDSEPWRRREGDRLWWPTAGAVAPATLIPHEESVSGRQVPWLHELLVADPAVSEVLATLGAYATTSALCEWWSGIGAAWKASPGAALSRLLRGLFASSAFVPKADATTGRICAYGGGAMLDLASHQIEIKRGLTAGHAGLLWTCLAGVDLAAGRAVAVHTPCISFSPMGGQPGAQIRRLFASLMTVDTD